MDDSPDRLGWPAGGLPDGGLVARGGELARVTRSVGHGDGAMVAGAAGMGKTALAATVAGERAASGVPVVWTVATAASRLTPFGALAPLLPPELASGNPALVPAVIGERLRQRFGSGRVLLVVDDAQLLDDHSAAAVLALVTSGVVRLLVTFRTGEHASDAVTALWKDHLLDRVDLGPLDRAGARALLCRRVGGDVAEGAVELLWTHSRGNPLFLSELARFGVVSGRFVARSGVWCWQGSTGVPPRLEELLRGRFNDVSTAGRDALEVLALGEPLPYDTLAAVTGPEAILELDERQLVTSDGSDGVVRLRFAHPLLHAVAARRLTPARRRAIAQRLCRAPADQVDLPRRASWQEAAGGIPDAELLLAAADSVLVTDPELAARLAERVAQHHDDVRSAVRLSHAWAELGQAHRARTALALAARRVRDDRDRFVVGLEEVSFALWTERSGRGAARTVAALRQRLPASFADPLGSAAALVAMFTARPAEALREADAVLGGSPGHDERIRALTVRMVALTLADRPQEAEVAAAELAAAVEGRELVASRRALIDALMGLRRLFHTPGADLPRASGPSGRWPALDPGRGGGGLAWSLLRGLRAQMEGNEQAAVTALREAYVQQCSGEGLFRSEAVAGLIVSLAGSGSVGEAAELLAEHPPDEVAVLPGLREWAAAAVAAAQGLDAKAGRLALDAASAATAAGARLVAMWYLADAARYGAEAASTELARTLPASSGCELTAAWASGIAARASADPAALVDAAERHLRLGLSATAAELAQQAAAARPGPPTSSRRPGARAGTVLRQAHGRLGVVPPALTRREAEVAALAARGLTDRAIAEALVVSVRTVESHLASAYRKLGINSRTELAQMLAAPAGHQSTLQQGPPVADPPDPG